MARADRHHIPGQIWYITHRCHKKEFLLNIRDDEQLRMVYWQRAGIGRTGVFAAGVLLHCGFEPKDAFDYISKNRGISVPDTQEQIDWLVNNYAAIVNT